MQSTLYDCLIVGGGPAGLAAALGLCRAVRTAVVFDSQTYRNRFTNHMHNVSTWDHADPHDHRVAARKELVGGRYSTTTLADVALRKVWKLDSGEFEATDTTGKTWRGRKVILATGVREDFPSLEGYMDCWPRSIYHCLFCHGFEERGGASVGVLALGANATAQPVEHVSRMAHNLSEKVTIYTNGDEALADQLRPKIERDEWLTLVAQPIRRLRKTDGIPVVVELEDGSTVQQGFLVHATAVKPTLDFEHNLQLEISPQGSEFKTTPPFNESTTPGCFATGDCASIMKAAGLALSHGSITAAGVVTQLVFDEKA